MTGRALALVESLCGSAEHPLAPTLRAWCTEFRPFFAFAEAHGAKIRKKVRLAVSDDERADLLAELAVAALFLRDRRFEVVYEPHRAAGERGPDLGVNFRTHTAFLVEVTRLRRSDGAFSDQAARLARVLVDKIGQFPPGVANLLAVVLPAGAERDGLVPAALRLLEAPPGPVPEVRPEGRQEFLSRRPRLGGVLLCSLTEEGKLTDGRFWSNPQAKHPLAPEVVRYLTGVVV